MISWTCIKREACEVAESYKCRESVMLVGDEWS